MPHAAHRQKNFEKQSYAAWGANPEAIEDLYKNDAYTKLTRRRLFQSLNSIPNKAFAVRLLHDAANSPDRSMTESHLALFDYIANLAQSGAIMDYIGNAPKPLIVSKDGTTCLAKRSASRKKCRRAIRAMA